MARKRRSPEEIVTVLREAERNGIADTIKKHNVTETTFFRWKKMYGGMGMSEVQRIRELEKENTKLKHLAGDQALVIQTMKEELKKRAGSRRFSASSFSANDSTLFTATRL